MFKTILCHQRFVIELYYLHIISVEWVILVQLTIKRKRVFSCTVNVHSSLLLLGFFSCLGKDLHFISEICNLTVVFFMSAEEKLTKKQEKEAKMHKFMVFRLCKFRIIKRQIISMESISFPLELLVECIKIGTV